MILTEATALTCPIKLRKEIDIRISQARNLRKEIVHFLSENHDLPVETIISHLKLESLYVQSFEWEAQHLKETLEKLNSEILSAVHDS